MTDQHPITPPPELVQKWSTAVYQQTEDDDRRDLYIATQAARWGADQELEACCDWLQDPDLNVDTYKLRAARRGPTLQMVKKRALSELAAAVAGGNITPERGAYIRLALEQLPND